jgi:hypothetical protein
VIGVCCKENEKNIVREFFELFKTPWELYEKSRSYEVILVTANEIPKIVDTNLLVIFGSEQREVDSSRNITSGLRLRNVFLNYQGIQLPIYGNVLTFDEVGTTLLYVTPNSDIAGLKVETSATKVLRLGYDLFQEIALLLSFGQSRENAHIPTLEIHISMLRNWILQAGIPLVEIPPVPKNYDGFVCLTHDVDFVRVANHKCDHTLCGFLYKATIGSFLNFLRGRFSISNCLINLGAVFSLPFVYIGLKKDFWLQFEKYLHIEKGLRSTYFFIPFKDRVGDKVSMQKPKRRAARYDIRDVQNWAKLLLEKGYEIGVHGIDGWHDSKKGRLELNEVTKAVGVEEAGIRTHWLCFDSNSPKMLEAAGFSYDSTFGYNETVGFRAGTAQVFRPLGAKRILEVSLHIQDVTLFNPSYLNMTDEEASQRCKEIIDQVLTYGGVLTILWHLRSIAPERLWGDFYTRLLEQLKRHRVWFATARQVIKWFRLRRAISFTHESFSDRALSVCLETTKELPCPEFALRLYKPISNEASLSEESVDYIEIPWLGEKSMTIPFEE